MNLKGRNFLTLKDFTPEEIQYLLDLSADLKDKKKKGIPVDIHKGKNVALIFEKTSTRTRCAFEVAAHDLGMGTTYLDPTDYRHDQQKTSDHKRNHSSSLFLFISSTLPVLVNSIDQVQYRCQKKDQWK